MSMPLTQDIVDRAKRLGYKLRAKGLYEARKSDEVFRLPYRASLTVIYREGPNGTWEFFTHAMAKEAV